MKRIRTYIAMLLAAAIAVCVSGCSETVKAADLMKNISQNSVLGKAADGVFTASMADFSLKLFKESITAKENSLISPLSVMLALAMTANGAEGETLRQMEALLGGGIPLSELNEYLHSYAKNLPSKDKSKLGIANSIWFRDDGNSLQVEEDFLQKNADYYSAAAYSSAFDKQTLSDINGWVKTNTDGMIDKILEEIKELDMLFLINAVVFDAEWQNVYKKENVRKGKFTDIDSDIRDVDFMHSNEYGYLDDGMATGFVKPYANGAYSFVALLPNEDVAIQDYIESLMGTGFIDTLNNEQHDMLVYAAIPKFEYDYSISMINALETLGVRDAFDEYIADFCSMGTSMVGNGNLYISEVLHKTYISVDELGTKAGAVTMVLMETGGSSGPPDHKVVTLDRPFVYAIIDNATNLPVFIGTLMTVK